MKLKQRNLCFSENRGRGFTLIELLVVMGIIVVMLAAGAIAFNTLTGRRSTGMAQTMVSAMLGRARTLAMNDQSGLPVSYGVLFFRDPASDRTGMVIIRRVAWGGGDPDPYDQYKSWVLDATHHYNVGDRVVSIVQDQDESMRPTPRRFRCILGHNSSNDTRPPYIGSGILKNHYWEEVVEDSNTTILDEVELLPAGVAVQTMTDVTVADPSFSPPDIYDRYLRTGVILFDRHGRLEHLSYLISVNSSINSRLGLTSDIGTPPGGTTPPVYTLYSQLGVVIYDQETFRSVFGADGDFDRNPYVRLPGQLASVPSRSDEADEEAWLDQNGSLLLVDRYSGELTKAR